MLDASLKSTGLDTTHIRKLLLASYKNMAKARSQRSQTDPKLEEIKTLQTQARRLRQEKEILNQPFIARGFMSVEGNL
jgi:hypothetical protein